MGHKLLQITLLSAKDLKIVNHFGNMNVYVVVSINGLPYTKQLTYVHRDGGSSPSWNHKNTMSFTFDEDTAVNAGWSVVLKLKHYRTFGWDKAVGKFVVSVKDLLAAAGKEEGDKTSVTYQVRSVGTDFLAHTPGTFRRAPVAGFAGSMEGWLRLREHLNIECSLVQIGFRMNAKC